MACPSAANALARQVGQLLLVGFDGLEAPPAVLAQLRAGSVAGVILFSRNLREPRQIAALNRAIRGAAAGAPPLIAVDQEGGRVQRLRAPLPSWPPMRALGERDDPALTEAVGHALGADLALLGFNVDFAPVLDVVRSERNTVIGDRSFGADPELVARHGVALAAGLARAGVLPCGKHFPGHGGPVADSHHTLPSDPRPAAELRAELSPFAAAVAATPALPLLMVAHVVYRALDAAHPATFSRALCHDLARGELGFGGVLCSDDMEMGAIVRQTEIGEAAVLAVAAGIDLLLLCHRADRQQRAREALIAEAERSAAFRERVAEAAGRVVRLRGTLPAPRPGSAQLAARLQGAHAELLRRLAG